MVKFSDRYLAGLTLEAGREDRLVFESECRSLEVRVTRLARNGRDWHTLIEFCGLVGTVIVNKDGIYEPRHPNDRLLLGMKGTMSELELSLLRACSMKP